jgi:hypothetical protein
VVEVRFRFFYVLQSKLIPQSALPLVTTKIEKTPFMIIRILNHFKMEIALLLGTPLSKMGFIILNFF